MSRAMDMGDIHEDAGHTSEYTVPTLLAATGLKAKVTGKEFITAYVVAQEMLIRIGIAFRALSGAIIAQRGHGHCMFGCTAAAGKLLDLSLEELINAEGIAREMTQPQDSAMFHPATLIVRVHHGFVAQDAINACLLARKGITGPREQVLTGPRGYLAFATTWPTDPAALTDGLGEKWEMTNTMMKPYSACKCTHTAIDGILEQMKEHGFTADDIASIHLDESSINWAIVCEPNDEKWHPDTQAACQFSLPYTVATAAYSGDVFLESYTEAARTRPDVRDLMERISAREDPSLPMWAARLHTTLRDGRKLSSECVYIKGHPRNPFTEQDLVDKLNKCLPYSAYPLSNSTVDSLVNSVLNLEKSNDVVSDIILPLTPL
jgi:2-methylcitrate dehydratase PrpD